MIPNRANNAASWDFETLIGILIRQFKRPLADHSINLSDQELRALAEKAAVREADSEQAEKLRQAMAAIVEESLQVLAGWSLSYKASLKRSMDDMPGWETTAEFLDIANEKTNAELRIAMGAALLAALGDAVHADKLWFTYLHGKDDPEDVDAVIARRALGFAAHIPDDAPDWDNQARVWLNDHGHLE